MPCMAPIVAHVGPGRKALLLGDRALGRPALQAGARHADTRPPGRLAGVGLEGLPHCPSWVVRSHPRRRGNANGLLVPPPREGWPGASRSRFLVREGISWAAYD